MVLKRFIAILLVPFLLISCISGKDAGNREQYSDYMDPQQKLSREDYQSMLPRPDRSKQDADAKAAEAPIPRVSPILVAPRPPKSAEEQLVSIAVTEDIPLRDVLIELARLANVDLEMDPTITGGVIFRAKDRPFKEVIDRIAHMEQLRYSFDGRVLRIERDKPYLATYPVDFLNISRSTESGVTINTNVLSAGGEGDGGSLNSGSKSNITAKSESDLWEKFEDAVKQILGDPQSLTPGVVSNSASNADGEVPVAADPASSGSSFYVLNKQGSLLTVFASKEKQDRVQSYLGELQKSASAQVLIEAKIVEVSLNDDFRSGIDWGSISMSENFEFNADINAADTATANVFSLTLRNDTTNDLEAAVNLMRNFGTSRTLSSPRIHAINNQQAVLTFAENQVYFEINVERETDTNSASNQQLLTVDSQIKTVPIGIILVVQPSINLNTDEVTLSVRPTLSRVTNRVSDPAVAFLASQATNLNTPLENLIPVVEVRELDTTMKIHSGDIMVMGGLMEDRSINKDNGVPYVSQLPVLGRLFKASTKEADTVEMVIFIKATVVPNSGMVSKQDIDLYRKFTADPRPLAF